MAGRRVLHGGASSKSNGWCNDQRHIHFRRHTPWLSSVRCAQTDTQQTHIDLTAPMRRLVGGTGIVVASGITANITVLPTVMSGAYLHSCGHIDGKPQHDVGH